MTAKSLLESNQITLPNGRRLYQFVHPFIILSLHRFRTLTEFSLVLCSLGHPTSIFFLMTSTLSGFPIFFSGRSHTILSDGTPLVNYWQMTHVNDRGLKPLPLAGFQFYPIHTSILPSNLSLIFAQPFGCPIIINYCQREPAIAIQVRANRYNVSTHYKLLLTLLLLSVCYGYVMR